MKSNNGKAYRGIPIILSVDFSAESLQARRSAGMIYLKWWKEEKTYNQDCTTQQVSHSDLTKKSKVYRQTKAKRIQHYQNSLTINASLGRKQKRRKKTTKTNTKQLKVKVKMSVALLCLTLCNSWTVPTRLLCPWDFPGKNSEMCCHSLLQAIFSSQGLNLDLLHCKQILYHLS